MTSAYLSKRFVQSAASFLLMAALSPAWRRPPLLNIQLRTWFPIKMPSAQIRQTRI